MPRTRNFRSTDGTPLTSARVLPESGVAASRRLNSLAPVEKVDVSTVEPRPTIGGQVPSIALPPILYAEDLELRSPVALESPSMPILEPYWKDDEVVQTSSPMTEVPPRPLQSGTSDDLGRIRRTRSPCRVRNQNLAPVAEFESSDVVASGFN